MRLILEINHPPYGTETIPLIYSSKENFLADFREEWDLVEPEDGYCINTFYVGDEDYQYNVFTRVVVKATNQYPLSFSQMEDLNSLKFIYIEPQVYTVDEWFEK